MPGTCPRRSLERSFEYLRAHYTAPDRFYHNLDHVMDVLVTVEQLVFHARNPNAVRLAAWLHDVIYDSKASNNEEQSAATRNGYAASYRSRKVRWLHLSF